MFTNEQKMKTFICDLISVSKATVRDATWLFDLFRKVINYSYSMPLKSDKLDLNGRSDHMTGIFQIKNRTQPKGSTIRVS